MMCTGIRTHTNRSQSLAFLINSIFFHFLSTFNHANIKTSQYKMQIKATHGDKIASILKSVFKDTAEKMEENPQLTYKERPLLLASVWLIPFHLAGM